MEEQSIEAVAKASAYCCVRTTAAADIMKYWNEVKESLPRSNLKSEDVIVSHSAKMFFPYILLCINVKISNKNT